MKKIGEKGMSLIQVLIAAAILGGLQLVFMRMTANQSKSVKTTEVKLEAIGAVNSIRDILSNKEACALTFGIDNSVVPATGTYDPNSVAAGVVTLVKNKENVTLYTANLNKNLAPKIGSSNLKLISLRLDSSAIANIPADSMGTTELFVRLNRGEKIFGTEEIEKRIRLNVLTDASGDMVECSTAAVDEQKAFATYMCSTLGGVFDDAGRGGNGDCHSLQPNGTTTFNGDIQVQDSFIINPLSDYRLKKDIYELEGALEKIRKIDAVSFKWKKNGKKDIGFIAQNIQEIYPEMVVKRDNGNLGVKYTQVISAAIKGLQELDSENQGLKEKLIELSRQQNELAKEIISLK